MEDSLGDRMKEYEDVTRTKIIRRMPTILRLDGRAFHTFTRNAPKPFDSVLSSAIAATALFLLKEVQTAVFGYYQSDEISLLLKDYSKIESQSWFGGNIQKITSISASLATIFFNNYLRPYDKSYPLDSFPVFDARVFNIPKEDVVNYFIWRQKDATRNSINSLAQSVFSHKDLQGKSQSEVLDKLMEQKINWNFCPPIQKRGGCVRIEEHVEPLYPVERAYLVDDQIPIFTEDREYISQYL